MRRNMLRTYRPYTHVCMLPSQIHIHAGVHIQYHAAHIICTLHVDIYMHPAYIAYMLRTYIRTHVPCIHAYTCCIHAHTCCRNPYAACMHTMSYAADCHMHIRAAHMHLCRSYAADYHTGMHIHAVHMLHNACPSHTYAYTSTY